MTVLRRAAILLLLAVGCGRGPTGGGTVTAHLGGGTAALVGGSPIVASLVADVARAQHVEPRVALSRLIDDALASEGARASGADKAPVTAWALQSILARAVAARVRADSRAAPPTDAEVAEVTARNWREFDLPEQWKVIHAVVMRPKAQTDYPAARALADQLVATEALAKNDDDFESRAKGLPHAGFEIVVERLPAFVADDRTSEGPASAMEDAFVKGAIALRNPGETSGIVETSYGWHVIRLVERRPPKVIPLEQRRAAFAEEIYARRGHAAIEALLEAQRGTAQVEIMPDVERSIAEIFPSASP
jgi:hypothetical protein